MKGVLIFLIIIIAIIAIGAVFFWYKRNSALIGTASSASGAVSTILGYFGKRK